MEGEVIESAHTESAEPLLLPGPPLWPDELYLLPLVEKPFFPAQTLPLLMNMEPWMDTVKAIGNMPQHLVGLVLVKPDDSDDAGRNDFYPMGTVARMHHPVANDGKIQFIAEGVRRFRIVEWLSDTPPYKVRVDYPNEPGRPDSEEIRAYAVAVINTIKELLPLNPLYSEELKFFLNRFSPNEPSLLTDFAATLTTAGKQELEEVLETLPLKRRMEKVLVLLKKELDVARLQSQIRSRMEEKMSQQQREFFLKEQLKTIQKELGLPRTTRPPNWTPLRRACKNLPCRRRRRSASTRRWRNFPCWKPALRNMPSRAITWIGSPSCPGASIPRTSSISSARAASSTATTMGWPT